MSAEAATVLQNIETLESEADLDALIRREIVSRQKKSKSSEAAIACPSCEVSNPASNKFCAECGAKLKH